MDMERPKMNFWFLFLSENFPEQGSGNRHFSDPTWISLQSDTGSASSIHVSYVDIVLPCSVLCGCLLVLGTPLLNGGNIQSLDLQLLQTVMEIKSVLLQGSLQRPVACYL